MARGIPSAVLPDLYTRLVLPPLLHNFLLL
jgi:hypothetical protein